MDLQILKNQSYDLRKDIIDLCYQSQSRHVGGSLSSIDLLNVLYFHVMNVSPVHFNEENRDRFILSKGHIAEALYVVLAKKGYFDFNELNQYCKYGSKYFGHPSSKVKGVELNSGALGHGLALGVGIAIAAKKMNRDYRTYVLMGDGELAEGSVWESAMAAAFYQLDNLCTIVDRNRLQISGNTEDIMALENLKEKWQSFGFEVLEIDGNNYHQIIDSFEKAKEIKNKPTLILANTIKGKGISFMENKASWHHGVITDEQYQTCLKELEEAKNEQNI